MYSATRNLSAMKQKRTKKNQTNKTKTEKTEKERDNIKAKERMTKMLEPKRLKKKV